jgi:hypothetical protein
MKLTVMRAAVGALPRHGHADMLMYMMITFNFHLTQQMHGDLQKAAHEQGRTAAEICRRTLAAALEQHKSGGEFRIVPASKLEPRLAARSALGAAPVVSSNETAITPAAAALPEVQS